MEESACEQEEKKEEGFFVDIPLDELPQRPVDDAEDTVQEYDVQKEPDMEEKIASWDAAVKRRLGRPILMSPEERRVKRAAKEAAARAGAEKERLGTSLGREPTLTELAASLQVEPMELAAAMESGAEVESLSKIIYHGDGNAICLIDKLEDMRQEDEGVLNRVVVAKLLEELPPQDARLITMRYYLDKTQTQVAQELGISQVQVSRMEKKILQTMRKKL